MICSYIYKDGRININVSTPFCKSSCNVSADSSRIYIHHYLTKWYNRDYFYLLKDWLMILKTN